MLLLHTTLSYAFVAPNLIYLPFPTLGPLATMGSIFSTFKEPYPHQKKRTLSFLYLVVPSTIFFQFFLAPVEPEQHHRLTDTEP